MSSLYVLLAMTVHLRLWAGLDLASTLYLEHLFPRSLDMALSVFSLIGSAEVTGLIILIYVFFFCPPGSRFKLLLLFALLALFEIAGKNIIHQPSPPNVFYHYVLPFSFPTSDVKTPFSFPSGHSGRTIFLTIVLVVWIQQRVASGRIRRALLLLLAMGEAVMLISRVSLGEHWSTDVVGGALLAMALLLPWLYGLAPLSQATQIVTPQCSPIMKGD